jgi:glucose-fructose oxidoreductase
MQKEPKLSGQRSPDERGSQSTMDRRQNDVKITRRDLLRSGAAAVAFPAVVSSSVLGANAPSNRIHLGHIGVGGRGRSLLGGFLQLKDCQCVAVADPFRSRREGAAARIDKHYGRKVCTAYRDFRSLIARSDVDAVVIATPDHWHVPAGIAAARAGKDMYIEKPLGLCHQWNVALREAIRQYGGVFQYGTQQRSSSHCRHGCELVVNGRIGEIRKIEVHAPAGSGGGSTKPIPVPADLDYDLWLGPAPVSSYTRDRCTSAGTYFIYDNSIGFLGGWGAHPLDIAVWGWDLEAAVPVEIEGTGTLPVEGLFDTVTRWNVRGKYANGVEFKFIDGGDLTVFYGTEGTVWISRGSLRTDPPSLKTSKIAPGERHLRVSRNHGQDLLDAIKTRSQPASNLTDAVRSDTISHLSDIAIRTGRRITWDPKRERIVGDDAAARMLRRALRAPWHL